MTISYLTFNIFNNTIINYTTYNAVLFFNSTHLERHFHFSVQTGKNMQGVLGWDRIATTTVWDGTGIRMQGNGK